MEWFRANVKPKIILPYNDFCAMLSIKKMKKKIRILNRFNNDRCGNSFVLVFY